MAIKIHEKLIKRYKQQCIFSQFNCYELVFVVLLVLIMSINTYLNRGYSGGGWVVSMLDVDLQAVQLQRNCDWEGKSAPKLECKL